MTSFVRSGWFVLAGASLVLTLAPLACGRIRPEDGDLTETTDLPDASTNVEARPDSAPDPFDSSAVDTGVDANVALDAGADAAVKLPAIDPTLPAPEPACAAGAGTAYLVAENSSLYAFDPQTVTTKKVGTIACPVVKPGATPWTMTVTQTDAYVLYNDWNLYRVRLDSLACTRTSFVSGQLGYPGDVGIGTSAGADEALFVYGTQGGASIHDLATSDLTTFTLSEVGHIAPLPVIAYPVDIKVDGYGRLFASDFSGALLMVDATSGQVLGFDHTGLATSSAWALLTYNDGVYYFMGDNGDAYRWDLVTKKAIPLGTIGDRIVGAGAAPCLH